MLTSVLTLSFAPSAVIGDCKGDIVFVLDSSASIGSHNWFVVKQFVMDVVRGLKISEAQTRVGVVSFSTMTVTNFHLEEYFDADDMSAAIWELLYMAGSTNTADGIKVGPTNGVWVDSARYCVHLYRTEMFIERSKLANCCRLILYLIIQD